MVRPSSIVVVGAGAAGAQAALTLRRLGYDGGLVLIGAEAVLPYERPPLSKEALTSLAEPSPILLVTEQMFSEQRIETILGSHAVNLSLRERCVQLSDERAIPFDRLLLATGASPRRLAIEGSHLAGVYCLRTWHDSMAIRQALTPGASVVIIGGGFIGLEVAASARKRGCAVTVVELASQLMGRAVPELVSRVFAAKHVREGVTFELRQRPVRICGDTGVRSVELEDGRRLDADVVVIGVGVVPNTMLATHAGIDVDDGIVADVAGRTSADDVFAAGDCRRTRFDSRSRGMRLEAWQSALDQGDRAAHAMIGRRREDVDVPWVWSDQYEYNLQIAGAPARIDATVVRGDPEQAEFICFQLCNGHLVGAVAVNRGSDLAMAKRLIAASIRADVAQLADPQVRLKALLPKSPEKGLAT